MTSEHADSRPLLGLAVALWVYGMAGCSARDLIGEIARGPEANGAQKPTDAGELGDDAGSRAAFCRGQGPDLPRMLGGQASACGSQVASQLFRYALCSCRGLGFVGVMGTDDFDSTEGPYVEPEEVDGGPAPGTRPSTGASVGVNQGMNAPAGIDIGGSLIVAGEDGLTWPASSPRIESDLRVRGDLNYVGTLEVGRDAWIQGALLGGGTLDIARDLYQPPMSERTVLIAPEVKGKDIRRDFTVSAPCACAEEQIIDVAAIVADGKANNHNLETGLDNGRLKNRNQDLTLELECGRYYLSEVSGQGKVRLVVPGRTAVFIAGDLTINDDFLIDVGDQGQLDLFVGGNLDFAAAAQVGSVRRPAAVRIYVAGAQALSLIGELGLGANLYAPNLSVSVGAGLSIHGSIFASEVSSFGDFQIHYDRAVLRTGDVCQQEDVACDSCEQCPASQGCVQGRCGACVSDADCCVPLACNQGVCGAPVPP